MPFNQELHRILVVDDDEDDLFLLSNYFEDIPNIKVHSIQNSLNVHAFLESLSPGELPEVIILDLNMPFKSGFEILQELKSDPRYVKIPVVVFTTSSTIEDKATAARLQAEHFLTKAYQFSAMKSSLDSILRNYSIAV